MKLILAIFIIILVGAGVTYAYVSWSHSVQNEQAFENKEKCSTDGAAWAKANPYPFGYQLDEYAYAPDLNTCLVYETDGSGTEAQSQQMIYDLYAGKMLAQCPDPFSKTCSPLNAYATKYFRAN